MSDNTLISIFLLVCYFGVFALFILHIDGRKHTKSNTQRLNKLEPSVKDLQDVIEAMKEEEKVTSSTE